MGCLIGTVNAAPSTSTNTSPPSLKSHVRQNNARIFIVCSRENSTPCWMSSMHCVGSSRIKRITNVFQLNMSGNWRNSKMSTDCLMGWLSLREASNPSSNQERWSSPRTGRKTGGKRRSSSMKSQNILKYAPWITSNTNRSNQNRRRWSIVGPSSASTTSTNG